MCVGGGVGNCSVQILQAKCRKTLVDQIKATIRETLPNTSKFFFYEGISFKVMELTGLGILLISDNFNPNTNKLPIT